MAYRIFKIPDSYIAEFLSLDWLKPETGVYIYKRMHNARALAKPSEDIYY